MHAERLLLETDHLGNLKNVPKLPPNKQLEAIVLVIADIPSPDRTQRTLLSELKGGLENSIVFAGDPLTIQEKLRDEWN